MTPRQIGLTCAAPPWQPRRRVASSITAQCHKDDFASDRQSFVSTSRPSSTLRDLQVIVEHLTRPQVLGVLCLSWLLVTIAGPFNTLADLTLPMRALYWGLVVGLTYMVGTVVTQFLGSRLSRRFKTVPLALSMTAIAVSIGVYAVIAALNIIFLPIWITDPVPAFVVYISVLLISFSVLLLRQATLGELGIPPQKQAMILERLPLDKRGALISLSVQDHYVDIVTAKGREMVLMRLSDAMREASDVAGMQIHRSHWVALDQITSMQRAAEAARVTLSNGTELPVSRGYLPAVRAAGLLPKTGKTAKSG